MNALKQDTDQGAAETVITVQTSRFGQITVDRQRIISMTSPFLGFPESSRFFLKPHSPKSPFMWFQSLENPDLAFVVIPATLLNIDYQPKISRQVSEELKLTSDKEKELLLILTIPKDKPQEMTANLLGPVVLNTRERLATQVVLDQSKYTPCWPLFQEK